MGNQLFGVGTWLCQFVLEKFSSRMKTILNILLILSGTQQLLGQKCLSRDYNNGGTVCVCNAEHCDIIEPVKRVDPPSYISYTSNKAGLRFEKEEGQFQPDGEGANNIILIEHNEYQEIFGFGGAFTDATGININSLDSTVSEMVMRAYFSDEGLEYNIGRVPIGATDFSTHPYSYQDEEDDLLSNFTLAPEDHELKIPLIRKAMDLTGGNLNLFASAWVAPRWMKESGNYSGTPGFLKESKYQVWANYFLKFLDEYKKQNIEFWGLSTGNEPSLAYTEIAIPSVAWTTDSMASWISNNLGPTIRNSSHSDIKLMLLDDQRMYIQFAKTLLKIKEVANFIDGTALHWYTDLVFSPELLSELHDEFPEKFIFASEACSGFLFIEPHVILGSWKRAEDYAVDIIQDLTHWATGWTDWNMALDTTGGPTYIDNNVDSPIIVNATSGEFYKQPTFYAMGHFSKFIPRGSVRIYSSQFDSRVPVIAFRRPDDGVAIIILNQKEDPVTGTIFDLRRGEIQFNLSGNSITSLLYW